MKKVLLVIFALISLNAFSQINVKEGSFRKIEGYVMLDKNEHLDDNTNPMALIKITTENISVEERAKFYFNGNLETYFDKQLQEDGQLYLYISAVAPFVEIIHPDYGKTEYHFPFDLCDFCGYEMVVQYVPLVSEPEYGFLAISSEPTEADIYVDGKHYEKTNNVITNLAVGNHRLELKKEGYVNYVENIAVEKGETLKLDVKLQAISNQKVHLIVKADLDNAIIYIDDEPLDTKESSKLFDLGTTHTWMIKCNMYHTESGTVTLNERTVIDKKLRPNFGFLNISTTPEQGAKVFVDEEYIGLSPVKTDKLKSGSHNVRVMKDMYKMTEKSFVVNDGITTNATLNMSANFVNVIVTTDSQSDIYVDDKYKGKGKWTGKLSDGPHAFEARKENHKPSNKSLELVLGETKTITLDAPKPINGSFEINSSPMGADIYIDGKHYGETPNYISEILIGEHELKLSKQGCSDLKKTIFIKDGETLVLNEKLQTGKEITITTDQSGDKIYVDGNYVGVSPITSNLSYGSHEIKAERNGKTVSKTVNVAQNGVSNVELKFNEENGHEYVDLGLSVKWAICNVGANKPEDYGNYYAWGETSTRSDYTGSNCQTFGLSISQLQSQGYIDSEGNLTSQYDAARANWGGSWRMPTDAEMQELMDKCTWTWTTQNGVNGCKVTGPNGNSIFLPAAGFRLGSSLRDAGSYGGYWGSTPDEGGSSSAYSLYFGSDDHFMIHFNRYNGLSVRPVLE